MAKRSSDPRVASLKVKVQIRVPRASCDECWSIASGGGGQYSGTIRFIEPQGVYGHMRPAPGAPRDSQAKFRGGTVWGLWKGPVGTGPVGKFV